MRDLSMWLKLRNQKCSPAFQASLLVKLRINRRSWKNGWWSITHYCVYPWPFPYRRERDGAVMKWWEHSPPTNVVRIQIAASTPRVGFVVGSLPCSQRFFSGQSGFHVSSKTNISKFQFFIVRTDTCSHTELLSVSWVNKLQFTKKISRRYDNYWSLHLRRWTRFSSHRKKICYCYYKYYLSSIIRNLSLRTRPVISAALATAHPPLPHPTKIFIVPAWDVSVQKSVPTIIFVIETFSSKKRQLT